MVAINYKIVMTGLICLTMIYLGLLLSGHDDSTIGFAIIGTIAMAIGVIIPSPKIDNNSGELKW